MIPASELILRPDGSVYHLKLRPEQIAPTIITVGDPERVALVSRHFDRVDHRVGEREFITHTGELAGRRLSVISTGIGTDNVDIVVNELDALVNIDLATREVRPQPTELTFLRLGTSGAFREELPLDSLLLSEAALSFDGLLPFYPGVRATALALPASPVPARLVFPRLPPLTFPPTIRRGITLTAAGFYGPQGRELRLRSALTPELRGELLNIRHRGLRLTNVEMETAGLYALATALGHRSASLSVLLANRVAGTFSQRPGQALDRLIETGLAIITGE